MIKAISHLRPPQALETDLGLKIGPPVQPQAGYKD